MIYDIRQMRVQGKGKIPLRLLREIFQNLRQDRPRGGCEDDGADSRPIALTGEFESTPESRWIVEKRARTSGPLLLGC